MQCKRIGTGAEHATQRPRGIEEATSTATAAGRQRLNGGSRWQGASIQWYVVLS